LGIAMLLASADRTIFAAAALSIKAELAMSLKDVGAAQSAFLWGYGVTQLAAGAASDRYGGAKVLLFGLFLWSTAVALTPFSGGVYAILAARFMFGAASGCALPASAAAVAAHVPAERRSGALSTIFALFNIGSAFGLAAAGSMIATFGWKFIFFAFGTFGAIFALLAYSLMPESVKTYMPLNTTGGDTISSKDVELEVDDLPSEVATQLVALLWCHIVVNWGFMILQSWLPIYLAQDLGLSVASSGLAGAIPWLFTAFMSFSSGQVADKLITKYGWEKWKVRRLAMNIATIGPALCLFALKTTTVPMVAMGFVFATLGLQAVAVAGYHSYLQDVAPSRAGAILGFTNTVGVVAAIIANMVTGASVEATGSFQTVFLYTASMYLSSCFAWNSFLKGQMLFP
jgi:ACS family sodium-dependent inorganic phosphate cotransporter